MIAAKTNDGVEEVFEADGSDDRKALKAFVEFIQKHDPDVIVGYNSNGFDWPYLFQRAKSVGVALRVDRLGVAPAKRIRPLVVSGESQRRFVQHSG